MKRSCLSKLPKCIKTMSPKKGIQIGKFLLAKTIVMPLMLVCSDLLSDGGVLGQMWPHTMIGKLLADSGNQAELNSTTTANSSSSGSVNEERNRTVNGDAFTNSTATEQEYLGLGLGQEKWILFYLFIVSILILIVSIVNLLRSNSLATLLRNARTTVMMNSRELERKDVPVPLGNSLN